MATKEKKRCGTLCQHPGCWQATKTVYQTPTNYLSYLNGIEKRKKRRDYVNRRVSLAASSQRGSVVVLPTLKINTLEHNDICRHECPNMHPQFVALSSLTGAKKDKQVQSHLPGLSGPKIHHVQMLLEYDEGDYNSLVNNSMHYTPVLVWQPKRRNQYSQRALKSHATSRTLDKLPTQHDLYGGARSLSRTNMLSSTLQYQRSAVIPAHCIRRVQQGDGVGRRKPLLVSRTDLTDTFSLSKTSQVSKVTELCNVGKDGISSLPYLCGIVLPPRALEKIGHQLRRESSINLIDQQPYTTRQTTKMYSNIRTIIHTPRSNSRTCDLYKNIYNLSASKLSKAARRTSSHRELKSFSRQLSTNPQEVMQRRWPWRKREAPELPHFNPFEVVEEDRIEAGKLNRWQRADNIAPHCTGISVLSHSKYLKALTVDTPSLEVPSSYYQRDCRLQQTRFTSQVNSLPCTKRRAKINKKNNSNYIFVHTARRDVTTSHHAITLRMDIDMSRDSGYRSTFSPNPLKHKLTSPYQQFSEDVPRNHDDVQDLVTYGRRALFSLSYDPTTPLTHSKASHNLIASVSPDYMLMSAKFMRGNLILTDKKRGTFVRQLTVSDSETNLESEFSFGHDFLSSPVEDDTLTNWMESSPVYHEGWIKEEDSTTNHSLISDDVFEEPDVVVKKQEVKEEEVEVEKEENGEEGVKKADKKGDDEGNDGEEGKDEIH